MQQRLDWYLVAYLVFALGFWSLATNTANAFEVVLEASGADEALQEKIKGASLVFSAKSDGATDSQDVIAAARSDYKRLVGVLYEQGYFGPSLFIQVNGIEADSISPFAASTTIKQVRVTIKTGPRFDFGKAMVGPLAAETLLPKEFATDSPANLSAIQYAARAGIDGWRDVGHAKAEVSSQTVIADHARQNLDVGLVLDPGPELTFGNLIYSSNSGVREKRIREIAALPTGKKFSPEDSKRVARRLRRTGAFRSIDLREAQKISPGDALDMHLSVIDDLPRRFGFGGELESREGLNLSGYWLHRNLLGGAENLRLDASIDNIGGETSGTDWFLGALYTRPSTFHSDTDLLLGVELKQEDEDLYFLRQASANIGIKRHFSERFETSIGANLRFSEVDDNFGERRFMVYGVPMEALYDQRDNIGNPTSGYYFSGSLMPYLGYDNAEHGIYLQSDLRGYKGIGQDNQFILAGRFQLGSVVGPSLASTPPDFLFYSGGGGTVRGQPYQSNFVTVNGIESGGLSFVGLSGEIRVKVSSHISTVAFYDSGFVGEASNFTGVGNWQSGAGLGVRYDTGFGPLRMDIGLPVSGGTGDGVQLYIGIGHAY